MPIKPGTFKRDVCPTPRHGDYESGRANSTQRGYDSRWRRFRIIFLQRNPLCAHCTAEGRTVEAVEVDHITPLRVAPQRKYDLTNLQGLCKSHHSRKTAAEQHQGAGQKSRA